MTRTAPDPDAAERCILVGVARDVRSTEDTELALDELAQLADTAGACTVARVVQVREAPDPATYIGRGKAEEVRDLARATSAETLIFDDELRPAQQRNLQEVVGAKVVDRTGLILDIFAQHAHSAEGKIQVELAQQRYRLTRLAGRGTELSRLGGGIGTRGPGEQKLEVDRRRIRRRIAHLERQLRDVERTRGVKAKRRRYSHAPQATLVGYTNAGKSTLMNRLTAAGVLVEDRLFSTVDPTAARLELPGGREAILTDTVGFLRKLPHQLVQAFRSTLEEVREADLLVHIVDAAAPDPDLQVVSVRAVLAEIGADDVGELVVANKVDIADRDAVRRLVDREGAVPISAVTGSGVDELLNVLAGRLAEGAVELQLHIPFENAALIDKLHREGEVVSEVHGPDGAELTVRIPADLAGQYRGLAAP